MLEPSLRDGDLHEIRIRGINPPVNMGGPAGAGSPRSDWGSRRSGVWWGEAAAEQPKQGSCSATGGEHRCPVWVGLRGLALMTREKDARAPFVVTLRGGADLVDGRWDEWDWLGPLLSDLTV